MIGGTMPPFPIVWDSFAISRRLLDV